MKNSKNVIDTSMGSAWVDEFIDNVRPYIFVREEDNLLIRMPNQAHRLNPQGVRVLKYLLAGGTAAGLMRGLESPERQAEVMLFLNEVKRCLEGRLNESNSSSAVEVKPLGLGFSQLPVLSELALTARCNLGCVFCYYGLGNHHRQWPDEAYVAPDFESSHKREMTTTEAIRVLKIIYEEARTPSVSFTGGEPTLRRDLPYLIEQASEIGLRVNLITNGTLVSRRLANELAGAGLSSAQVSIEGTTASVHEAITGVPGSHAKSIAGVANLRAAGIGVHTNTTLNRLNVSESADIPRFVANELGLERFSMNLVIPSGSAGGKHDILLSYSEIGQVVEMVQAKSKIHEVEFMWYSPTPVCIFNPIPRGLGNKGCAACDGLLSIDCNGDVLPCSSWAEPVGNILESEFTGIWRSERAAALRDKSEAHPQCRECDNFASCHGACPLYWRHFGFSELEDQLAAVHACQTRSAVGAMGRD